MTLNPLTYTASANLNTSFNLRGEPIVCDHVDAYHCFRMSDIDILVLDNCVVTKPGVELNPPPGSVRDGIQSIGAVVTS